MKDTRPLYECDPKLNTVCKKTGCYINGGDCFCTQHPEFSSTKREVSDSESLIGTYIHSEVLRRMKLYIKGE